MRVNKQWTQSQHSLARGVTDPLAPRATVATRLLRLSYAGHLCLMGLGVSAEGTQLVPRAARLMGEGSRP